jgi:hypothetical protein
MKIGISVLFCAVVLLPVTGTGAEVAKVLPVDQAPVLRDVVRGPDGTLNQVPDQSNGVFSDVGCDICGSGVQVLGDNFIVSTAGMGYDLDQVILWGGYYPNDVPVVAPFDFYVFPDAGGIPGAASVCSFIGITPTSDTLTGLVLFGVSEHLMQFDFTPCNLADGTYWLQLFTDTGFGTDDFFWEAGVVDPVNGIAGSVWATEQPAVTWNIDVDTDMAVQITGTTVPVELQSFSIE